MILQFTHTPDDYAEALKAKAPKNPARPSLLYRIGILALVMPFFAGLPIMIGSSAYLAWRHNPLWLFPLIVLLLLALTIARQSIWPPEKSKTLRALIDDPHGKEPITVEIDDAGFHRFTPHWQCHIKWPAVRIFFPSASLLLIADDQIKFIIPKRAFANSQLQEEFTQFIRDRMGKTRLQTT